MLAEGGAPPRDWQLAASQTGLNLGLLYSRVNLGAPLIWNKSKIPDYSSAAVAGAF